MNEESLILLSEKGEAQDEECIFDDTLIDKISKIIETDGIWLVTFASSGDIKAWIDAEIDPSNF